MGYPVRTLLRPSKKTPNLPKNIPVESVICSLQDHRGLRAAMRGVDLVFHLAGSERKGQTSELRAVDIEGTSAIVEAAIAARIQRLFYLSHLGSDRASGYPLLKAKAIAESHIIRSGIPFTIFRSAIVFGPHDQFTESLSRWIEVSPGFVLIPDQGNTILQPIWIEDLIHCISLSMDDQKMTNQVISIGGGDFLTFRKIVLILLDVLKLKRIIVSLSPSYMRILSSLFEQFPNSFCLSGFWLDYLASDRTTDLNVLPRTFGLLPAQFNQRIDYLRR
jgi:NADH dehydrogenase